MPRDEERLAPWHFREKSGAVQQATSRAIRPCFGGRLQNSACATSGYDRKASTSRQPWPRRSTCQLCTLLLSPFRAIVSEGSEGLEREPDIIATLDRQRSELVRSSGPFIAKLGNEPEPFRECGGSPRSAAGRPSAMRGLLSFRVCGGNPNGSMAAEEFGPLR